MEKASHIRVVYSRPLPGPITRLQLANRFGARVPRDWVMVALSKTLLLAAVLYFILG